MFWLGHLHYSIFYHWWILLYCLVSSSSLLMSFILVIIFSSSDWFFFIFSSSLLKVLLCSSILFPSSFLLLMLSILYLVNYLFVSLVVLFRVFSLLFHLKKKKKKLFCLFILFNFLCFYETWWSTYLSWSRRCALMWEHPDADCMGPVAFMGELEWAQATFSPRVSPWWEVGLEMEGLSQSRKLELLLCSVAVTTLSGMS